METKQFTNPDRNRYYGLRQGDVVIPQYQKEKICEVERLGFLNNNSVQLRDLETGELFDYVAEHCELIMKVEDTEKGKGLKTYVITLSRKFPVSHKRAGEQTNFAHLLGNALFVKEDALSVCKHKKHTIRANFPLWENRIAQIQNGEAVLSVRQWTGKPYQSKQVEIARLTAEDGVGIQELKLTDLSKPTTINGQRIELPLLAKNDGLGFNDWFYWFEKYDLSKPLAIIHFTKFRY